MASSAGAAHMVHLCSIWATPWEQYEICQCQSQALCAHLCIPASGVRRITITTSLRSSIWSKIQQQRIRKEWNPKEDEKRMKPKLFGSRRYWRTADLGESPSLWSRGCTGQPQAKVLHGIAQQWTLLALKELRRTWSVEAFRLDRKIQRTFPQHYAEWCGLTLG